MPVEVSEKGRNFGMQIGGLVFEREKSPSDGLEGIRLNDRPFFHAFHLLLGLKEKSQFGAATDRPVEGGDLHDLKLVPIGEFLVSGCKDRAILQSVHQALQLVADFRWQEYERFLGAEQDDSLGVFRVEEAVVIDLLPREAQEEPIEQEGRAGVVAAVHPRDQ